MSNDKFYVSVATTARLLNIPVRQVNSWIHEKVLRAYQDTPDERTAKGYGGKLRWNVEFDSVLEQSPLGAFLSNECEERGRIIDKLTHTCDQKDKLIAHLRRPLWKRLLNRK